MADVKRVTRRSVTKAILGMVIVGVVGWTGSRSTVAAEPVAQAKTRPNILFIAVDDLRPEMGCYGGLAKTPNMDALAARGMRFNRAYCQQAICSPSRTSLLTGCRPDTTKVWNLETHFRTTLPDVITLPQQFKNSGYHSQAYGKIYHSGLDDALSWSVPSGIPDVPNYDIETETNLKNRRDQAIKEGKDKAVFNAIRGPSWACVNTPEEQLGDGITADAGVRLLRERKAALAKDGQPFFLAIGFIRPHLPFVAPKKYFDLYPPETIGLAPNPNFPKDAPAVAVHNSGELRTYGDIDKTAPITDEQARQLRRAYFAATSFADAQIGKLLDELKTLGLADNTIVIVWGDHGWHLGDVGMWCKHTNFEIATRSPLIIAGPGINGGNATSNALVEFVDIYPTLVELAGLDKPKHLEGTSFAPLLTDPNRSWKKAAFSQYPRNQGVMGYSVRMERYRYTQWLDKDRTTIIGRELYDYQTDPNETTNLANQEQMKNIVAEMAGVLKSGWQGVAKELQTSPR